MNGITNPTTDPRGVASDPIIVARARWLSGNQMEAILAGAIRLKGLPIAIMHCPTISHPNPEVTKYLTQAPITRAITAALVGITKPKVFAIFPYGNSKTKIEKLNGNTRSVV
mmetsp:Transcript_12034/g.12054  ORF Transcript_12034/g.12054 Transcript_12034/m.12054 type:complete len:112 (-) Transcript_12034:280-615(-)